MSIGFESQPSASNGERSPITYELITYVFECMPNAGGTIPLEQVAEDLEETPETILTVIQELRSDELLDFTCDEGIVTVAYKDEDFLQMYSVYKSVNRSR